MADLCYILLAIAHYALCLGWTLLILGGVALLAIRNWRVIGGACVAVGIIWAVGFMLLDHNRANGVRDFEQTVRRLHPGMPAADVEKLLGSADGKRMIQLPGDHRAAPSWTWDLPPHDTPAHFVESVPYFHVRTPGHVEWVRDLLSRVDPADPDLAAMESEAIMDHAARTVTVAVRFTPEGTVVDHLIYRRAEKNNGVLEHFPYDWDYKW